MRGWVPGRNWVSASMLAGAILVIWSAVSFAVTPILGTDCGTGAAVVGSDVAGKVTLGTGVTTCTIEFSLPPLNPPACSAVNETNGGGYAIAVGARTTTTTLELDSLSPWNAGDVISYMCQGY